MMTLKQLVWIPLAFAIAWYWGDDLSDFVTFIPIAQIIQFLSPSDLLTQTPTFYVQATVWMILIWFIFSNINLPFGFIATKPTQYGTTKLVRRMQGVFAELTFIGIIFIALCFVFTLAFGKTVTRAHLRVMTMGEIEQTFEPFERNRPNYLIEKEKLKSLHIQRTKLAQEIHTIEENTLIKRVRKIAGKYDLSVSIPEGIEFWSGLRAEQLKCSGAFGRSSARCSEFQKDPKYLFNPRSFGIGADYNWQTRNSTNQADYAKALQENQLPELIEKIRALDTEIKISEQSNTPQSDKVHMAEYLLQKNFAINPLSQPLAFLWSFGLIANKYFYVFAFISMTLFFIFNKHLKGNLSGRYARYIRFMEQGRFGLGGSGRFAGLLEEWDNLYKPNTLFMGRSLYNPFLNIGLKDDMHMLTIAGSRSGKGTTAIIPNLLLWEGSAIVIDPKGTNAAVTARQRREMGQQVYVIDPFGVVEGEECASFNPLDGLDPDSPMIREQLSSIAEALVVPDPNVKDMHWDDGAKSILTGFLAQLICSNEEPTLNMLRDLLSLPEEETIDLYATMATNHDAGGAAKEAASRITRGMGTNEILGLLSNADKHTEWLSSPVMHKAIEKASFKFSEIKDTPTTVYLVLPPEQLKKHNRFLRLFINTMISQMAIGGRAKTPVLMIMDEFLALGRMTEIEEAFAVMASYNLTLWPFVQDMGRLNDIYGNSVNAFITNSRAVQVFGVTDSTTTEYISNNLGKKSLASPKLVENSRQNVPHRTPDEVAKDISRKGGRQYILRAGEAPLLLEKVPYFDGQPIKFVRNDIATSVLTGLFQGKYDIDPDFK